MSKGSAPVPTPSGTANRRTVLWFLPLLILNLVMPMASRTFHWPAAVTMVVQLAVLVMMVLLLVAIWRTARARLRDGQR
jgi:uncharacterized membrane protein